MKPQVTQESGIQDIGIQDRNYQIYFKITDIIELLEKEREGYFQFISIYNNFPFIYSKQSENLERVVTELNNVNNLFFQLHLASVNTSSSKNSTTISSSNNSISSKSTIHIM